MCICLSNEWIGLPDAAPIGVPCGFCPSRRAPLGGAAGTTAGIARAAKLPKGLSAPFMTATVTILLQSDFTSMFRKKD